ncbi:homoserine kinase [Quercus suber]|uniref:Homoserine kinase n=1 Tax=Quercus suber TaxID=58331 RepID=A0AAW0JS89_QUESU
MSLENSATILTPIMLAGHEHARNPIGRTFFLTRKGLPLGSGLGSKVAAPPPEQSSSINCSAGSSRRRSWYMLELKSEEKKLNFPAKKDLYFVLVSLEFKALTKKMRAALPSAIGMANFVWNSSQAVALGAAVLEGDMAGLVKALLGDRIVKPRRAPLILGMEAVKKVTIEAGVFGCTISGVRPTVVAMIDCEERGVRIGERMVEAFWREGGLKVVVAMNRLDQVGARLIDSKPR